MTGFRVDANEKIATGHLMRCMAIAAACEKRGEQVLFFLAEDKETERLRAGNFPFEILGTDWQDMEGETDRLVPLLNKYAVDWLVVDSYQATESYLATLNQMVRVLYVDDFGKRRYDVSAVLHYSPWTDERELCRLYQGCGTKLLLGGKYIPLRKEFSEVPDVIREHSVLITTGGTDTYNVAGGILQQCAGKAQWAKVDFHVIVGSMNTHWEKLQLLAGEYPTIHLHRNISNMSDYMRKCELAVSAGGTTLFELCACGIPTICFSFADNQIPGTEAMGRQGVMVYAGDVREEINFYENMENAMLQILNNSLMREKYSAKMRRLVDGDGAGRIAETIIH